MISIIAIGFSVTGDLMAQKDTIQLAPAIVTGFAPERFMSGLKVQRIDSATLGQFRFQNIGDLLSLYTPIAMKNYGPGQLATASFRGTSANHTAVLWNGLNINSPILGQTDFSTIPVAGFDKLSVQYGSSASVVGTDAVGGSILLGSVSQPLGYNISLGRRQESFNNSQTQMNAGYGAILNKTWTFSGKTSLYEGAIKNNFNSTGRHKYAFLPSETYQKGFAQDIFLRSANNQELSAHVWITKNKLTLTPGDLAGRELTMTEAYRTMIRYQWKSLTLRTSWVRDVIDYAKGDFKNLDHAVTDRFSNRLERDFILNPGQTNLLIKAGGEWTNYRASVAGYERQTITENRADIFILSRWQLTTKFLVSVNLRQAFVTKYNPPFTPSLGAEYQLINHERYHLKMKGSFARSYRVPTLNERYWKNLGNPDIKPETGWNKELGLEQRLITGQGSVFTGSVTGYHNRIKDWTYWNPAKNYKVENLQEVLSRGVEIQASWNYRISALGAGMTGSYAYTRSSQERIYDNYAADVVGKQLVFVPVHSGNFNAFLQYKRTKLGTQVQVVGKRYKTFDNSQFFDPYVLTNLLLETTFGWDKFQIQAQGQVNNLTDTFYLNVRNNAMPGRSFAINLLFSYNTARK